MDMHATMMHMPMTVRMLMEHGHAVFPDSRIGVFDGESTRYARYSETARRAAQLAHVLHELGVQQGDRVATFSWNNQAHMEAYLAVPSMGAILHTANIRLSVEQVAYILNHAEDKVVILDEADSMTSGAQQALRRTMEVFSGTTRFALACNVSTKIIEPIQSRCGIIRFSRLADKEVLERLVKVAELEKVATVQGTFLILRKFSPIFHVSLGFGVHSSDAIRCQEG